MSVWQIFLDGVPWWAWVTVAIATVGIVVEVCHIMKFMDEEDDYADEIMKRSGVSKK